MPSRHRSGISLNGTDMRALGVVRELGYRFESDAFDLFPATYQVAELTEDGAVVVRTAALAVVQR